MDSIKEVFDLLMISETTSKPGNFQYFILDENKWVFCSEENNKLLSELREKFIYLESYFHGIYKDWAIRNKVFVVPGIKKKGR